MHWLSLIYRHNLKPNLMRLWGHMHLACVHILFTTFGLFILWVHKVRSFLHNFIYLIYVEELKRNYLIK